MKRRDYGIENMMVLPETRSARGRNSHVVTREEARSAAYAATERRLHQMKLICARIEDAKEELAELENLGVEALREHSSSLVRLLRPGMRLDPEEVHAAQMAYLRSRLAADEREIRKMTVAMECVKDDPYFPALDMRYARGMTDAEIAEKLACDKTTVARHRKMLARDLSVRLYGVI